MEPYGTACGFIRAPANGLSGFLMGHHICLPMQRGGCLASDCVFGPPYQTPSKSNLCSLCFLPTFTYSSRGSHEFTGSRVFNCDTGLREQFGARTKGGWLCVYPLLVTDCSRESASRKTFRQRTAERKGAGQGLGSTVSKGMLEGLLSLVRPLLSPHTSPVAQKEPSLDVQLMRKIPSSHSPDPSVQGLCGTFRSKP